MYKQAFYFSLTSLAAKITRSLTRPVSILMAVIPITLLIACTPRIDIAPDEEVSVTRRSFTFEGQQSFDMLSRYRISAGDVLDVLYQIRTWLEKEDFRIAADHTVAVNFVYTPELNTQQLVRPNGMITLPYLGDIYVIGKTPKELEKELQEAYSTTLRDPEIFVQIPDFQSAIQELKKDLHTAPRGLSRLVTVHPDGYVTFPMLGEVMVAGRTIEDVNKELNRRYETVIPGLHVDLFLEKHTGTQVYVLGAVEKAGGFLIGKPISVAQALALAGGYRNDAEISSVIIARRHQDKVIATRLDLTKSADLGGRGALFFLMPDDIVYVPRTQLSEAAQIGTELREVLMFRGWSINVADITLEDF